MYHEYNSLIISYISGITLLGLPADVYIYGMQYAYVTLGFIFTAFVMNHIYLPVYKQLQITSTYEVIINFFLILTQFNS